MRAKLLSGVAALALTAGAIAATAAPASAAPWGWRHGGWPAAAAVGILGGAAVAAATSPLWAPGYYGSGYYDYDPGYAYGGPYDSGYAYGPGPGYATYGNGYGYAPPPPAPSVTVAQSGDAEAYCAQRFRSYDPASGTYLGFDGMRHPCP